MLFTDTHCHLDFPDYQQDLEAVIERATSARVHRLISIGTTVESSTRALQIARQHPHVYATAGIHPGNAESADESSIAALAPVLEDPHVVAIGECGLDYHHLPDCPEGCSDDDYARQVESWKAHQKMIFLAQLDLAARLGKNVVIHQRDSWEDVIECLRPYQGKLKAVFHCFGEAPERAREAIDAGHFLSFTGIVTFKNAQQVRESAAVVPDDHYMVETDAPYLAPHPHRGKRNESSYIPLIAQTLADVRGVDIEEISRLTEATTNHFFGLCPT